ncbi:hypothetical protein [Streptomyces sp. Caat 7-52]|nr:hypothetical protein [Streptomyces sp. Caat 7-52]
MISSGPPKAISLPRAPCTSAGAAGLEALVLAVADPMDVPIQE